MSMYTMIGYGVIEPPRHHDTDVEGWRSVLGLDFGVETSYEASPDFLIIPLAGDGDIFPYTDLARLDRFSCLLCNMDSLISRDDILHAKSNWAVLQTKAKTHLDIDVPEGKLIFVSDWR